MQADDETSITDIEIGPDGRIYIFGASREILELLDDLGFTDEHLRVRLAAMRQSETTDHSDTQQASDISQ